MGELRYLSADAGYTIVAALPALVLLPAAPESAAAADAVWRELAQPETTLERVVSSIPLRDPGARSFLVLWLPADGSTVTAVARGSAAADIRSPGGARRFGSLGAHPWHMARFDEVRSVVAGVLPPLPESDPRVPLTAHPLGRVVATGSTVFWTADDTARHLDGGDDDTVITRTRPRPGAVGLPPVEEVAIEAPAIRIRVVHPGGELELGGPVVFGRRPSTRSGRGPSGSGDVRLVSVPSPTGVVSADHVEIARSGSTVVVTDLRSTNGTVVTLTDGSRVRLRQGDSVAVAASARVDIGDGVVLRILPADAPVSEPSLRDTPHAPQEYRQ